MDKNFHTAYYLPSKIVTNEDLGLMFPDWDSERVWDQTGIMARHYAAPGETACDMAVSAAERLFHDYNIDKNIVDFIILVTQCQDYKLPATSCIIQNRLGLKKSCGAVDLNLGCSGFVYALSVAKSMILCGNASNVLVLTSDNLSRYVNDNDKALKTLIGDGATGFIVSEKSAHSIGKFIFGTDGEGYNDIIIKAGGERMPVSSTNLVEEESLTMNGINVFTFAITAMPPVIDEVLNKNSLTKDDIDIFVFHQANKTILDYLRKKINVPKEKFYINMASVGNTSSCTIPLALKMAEDEGVLKSGMTVLLLGFGVGLSWCGTVIRW